MKKMSFMILACLGVARTASAQISHPDSACLNSGINFSAPINNTYYSWQLNTNAISVDINTVPASINALGGTATVNASWTTMQRDADGNWYGFYTYYPSGSVHRLNFGSSPLNTPTDNTVGSYSTDGIIQGIDIVYDKANSKWYGFVVGGSDLIVLNFGTALGNTPAAATYDFTGKFSFPHQVGIKKFDKDWVGFVADRNGSIVRLDFPSGLASQPVATNLPIANYSSPCNFCLYQSNGNWYMIVPSLLEDNKIALLDFGNNIKNNTPVSYVVGGQISNISIPRSLNLFSNCGNDELLLYVTNEGGGFTKLDFDGEITNNVSAAYLGNFTDGGGVMTNFVYDNKVYGLKVSSNGSIGRVALFDLPQAAVTEYMDETLNHSFTQAGQIPLRLMVDPGLVIGTGSYCDEMLLKDCNTSINDVAENADMISQNIPNPTSSITVIDIQINKKAKNKTIVLKDQLGRLVHVYDVKESGSLQIDVTKFQPGIYFYSLMIDGKIMQTRKLVVLH